MCCSSWTLVINCMLWDISHCGITVRWWVDNHFTRQYNPEDSSEHHTRHRENLKSHRVIATLAAAFMLFSVQFSAQLSLKSKSVVKPFLKQHAKTLYRGWRQSSVRSWLCKYAVVSGPARLSRNEPSGAICIKGWVCPRDDTDILAKRIMSFYHFLNLKSSDRHVAHEWLSPRNISLISETFLKSIKRMLWSDFLWLLSLCVVVHSAGFVNHLKLCRMI
jgi:hypothetical protein